MRLLNRYIFRTIFMATIMVLVVIISLDLLAVLIDELGRLSVSYTFFEIVVYIGLSMPASIYEFMPFAALVGSLAGLGSLATSNELVIMRAAGISLLIIVWGVIKPVLIFVIFSILLGEYVIPITNQTAEARRALLLGKDQVLESRASLWNREGNEFMHFNAVQTDGVIYGVTRYQFDNEGVMQSSSFSETAVYQGDYWQERNITETTFTTVGTKVQKIAARDWNNVLSPQLLNILVLKPDDLAIVNLYTYSRYLDRQKISSSQYWLSFWKKLLQPLATISLVLIAVSFIFGPLREATMGYRLFAGVIVGILFQMAQNLLAPASLVYGFPPLIAVVLPIFCCSLWGFLSLRKVG